MKKFVYFKNNDLVRAFCGQPSIQLDRYYFHEYFEDYKNCIIVCYGLSNHDEVAICKQHNISYVYIDNGYFGFANSYYTNLKCRKNFYRIVANEFVNHTVENKNDDRLQQHLKYLKDNYNIENYIENYKRHGQDIILVPPSGKILKICGIDPEMWVEQATQEIKRQYDFPIVVRSREKNRHLRFQVKPIHEIWRNAYATVTFSSMAGVESVIFGVPNFIFNNHLNYFHSAAEPVSRLGLENIDQRFFPTYEFRYQWLSNLAYHQFTREEIGNGIAKKMIIAELKSGVQENEIIQ